MQVRGDNTIAFGTDQQVYGSNVLSVGQYNIDIEEMVGSGQLVVAINP